MMNKDEYIKELDNIKAPDELKKRILDSKDSKEKSRQKKKVRPWQIIAAAVACVVVVTAIIPLFASARLGASKSMDRSTAEPVYGSYSYNTATDDASYETAAEPSVQAVNTTASKAAVTSVSNRKITKNAEIYVQTKNMTEFIDSLNKKTNELGGYNEVLNISSYSSGSADLTVRIPAEKLDEFVETINEIGTIQSKIVSVKDITDSYQDTESEIKALETEIKALLGILEKCETVADSIEVQSRLSEVRGRLDLLKSQKANYDSMISYSVVSITVQEEERIIRNDDSFSSRVKTKFEDSVYNITNFFKNIAVGLIGGILYILIIAAVAAVVIVIIKKKRNNKK